MDSYFDIRHQASGIWYQVTPCVELEKLKNRVMKYVVRLNYGHFSQFGTPIEFLTRTQYFKIQSQVKAIGPKE